MGKRGPQPFKLYTITVWLKDGTTFSVQATPVNMIKLTRRLVLDTESEHITVFDEERKRIHDYDLNKLNHIRINSYTTTR